VELSNAAPGARAHTSGAPARTTRASDGVDTPIDLLLIEDDPGDAFLVEEQLDLAGANVRITVAHSLAEAAHRLVPGTQCVLMDLQLPDAFGIDGLKQVLAMAPEAAIVVLTARDDIQTGVNAVAVGAADYLVKQKVDGPLLARAIRYAIERKRADDSQRKLVEAELRGQENRRIERGLLPVPLIDDATLSYRSRYRPGRRRALLGGDFYDAVQTEDGTLHAVIGDVCGHGPDEAVLGVELRIAWRTLVLSGHTGQALLSTLDTILGHERRSDEIFTTLCMISIAPDRRSALLYLAGHPAPLLFEGPEVRALPEETGPALGLLPGAGWPAHELTLPPSWSLLLYTDGLIEGHVGEGPDRLGTDGLVRLTRGITIGRPATGRAEGAALIDELVERVERMNGGDLTDDLAVLLLARST